MKRKASTAGEERGDNLEEVSVRRRINFDDYCSDEEIIFDSQAHKKRKMTKDFEELKVWLDAKLDQKLEDKMANVATKDQTQSICLLYTSDAADE